MLARVPEVNVEELKAARDRGDEVTLVDVREAHEWAISDLPDSVKIPLATLPQKAGELSREADIVVYCRTGGRSSQAVEFLRRQGFERVRNLTGGINRWADAVDPSMRKY